MRSHGFYLSRVFNIRDFYSSIIFNHTVRIWYYLISRNELVMVHLDSKLQNHDECDLGCPRDASRVRHTRVWFVIHNLLFFEKFTSSKSLLLLVGGTEGRFFMIYHTFNTTGTQIFNSIIMGRKKLLSSTGRLIARGNQVLRSLNLAILINLCV